MRGGPKKDTMVTMDVEVLNTPRWFADSVVEALLGVSRTKILMTMSDGRPLEPKKNSKVDLLIHVKQRHREDMEKILEKLNFVSSYDYIYTTVSTGRTSHHTFLDGEN